MNHACAPVTLRISATHGVVLAELRGISERLTETHRMEKPMRTSSPCRGEAVRLRRQGAAEEIIFRIPVAEIAAEEHGENALDVIAGKVRRAADAVAAIVITAAATVRPQIILGSDRREVLV